MSQPSGVAIPGGYARTRRRGRPRALELVARVRPELASLLVLSGVLNLWALGRNGWANTYYSAAVRSMSTSWHNFLFASFDPNGVMTVDKPPLALWVQALSVRVFGYHPLSILVPQALMGMATVALIYDLTRRRFGRAGGFAAGLVLAVTPITVAISRHNNPDALLVLCCVAALWCLVRGLETGRTRWLVLCGVAVGLGFETKMAVALMVVPGIAAAYMWVAPRGRLAAMRQLLAGGAALVLVGGAWPLLVTLTPAADRPWISGTSDNSIWSLIFGYNGLGRLAGQSGGPGGAGPGGAGGGGTFFGGSTGPLRLLNEALGGQAGWLLGFALVSGIAVLAVTRLRRTDPRTGWLLAIGGAFLTTAVAFSFASGIFHPYYVSLLAPFSAALVGAGAATLMRGGTTARVLGPLAVAAGVATELAVLHVNSGQLTWLAPLLVGVGIVAALALAALTSRRARAVAVGAALALLLIAPTAWAFDTLGHATSGTFPAGGPASVGAGGPGGGFGPGGGRAFGRRGFGGAAGAPALFGNGSSSASGASGSSAAGGATSASGTTAGGAPGPGAGGFAPGGAPPAGAGAQGGFPGAGASAQSGLAGGPGAAASAQSGSAGGPAGIQSGATRTGFPGGGFPGGGFAAGGGPGGFGGDVSTQDLTYVKQHGGGAIAVASQSSAASEIIGSNADVVGIGGFSGRESEVSLSWFAQEVRSGKIRWVLTSGGQQVGPGADGRVGADHVLTAVAKACTAVSTTSSASGSTQTSSSGLYDCAGHADALLKASA